MEKLDATPQKRLTSLAIVGNEKRNRERDDFTHGWRHMGKPAIRHRSFDHPGCDGRWAMDLLSPQFVAMFYWTWHVDGNVAGEPVNVELVTRHQPEATNDYSRHVWKRIGRGYHWDEPLLGYYRSTDPWVLRKHAEMLADADVDVIVFDATNGSLTWKNAYEVLFPVFEKALTDGVRVPRVAFMLPFGPSPDALKSITQLYNEVYQPGRFKDLWFEWKGKPLVMAYPDNVPKPIKSFFTFRPGQPIYKGGQGDCAILGNLV